MQQPKGISETLGTIREKIERDLASRGMRRLTPEEYRAAVAEQHRLRAEEERCQVQIDY